MTQLTGLSVRSVNDIFLKIRRLIWLTLKADSTLSGAVEIDESYFDPHRVMGKRGRGASAKTIVFGILKRQGKVYTEIVPNCAKTILQAVISEASWISALSFIPMGEEVTTAWSI